MGAKRPLAGRMLALLTALALTRCVNLDALQGDAGKEAGHDAAGAGDASGQMPGDGAADVPGDAPSPEGGACDPAHLMADAKNCGACGHVCKSGACVSGQCPVTKVATNLVNPVDIAVTPGDDVAYTLAGSCPSMPSKCSGCSVFILGQAGPVDQLTGCSSFNFPIATDGASFYWAIPQSPGGIYQVPVAGASQPLTVTPAGVVAGWSALAADAKHVFALAAAGNTYYASASASLTWSPLLPGSGSTGSTSGGMTSMINGSADEVYWFSSATVSEVRGASLSAGAPAPLGPLTLSTTLSSMAAVPGGVVLVESSKSELVSTSTTLSPPKTLVKTTDTPGFIIADSAGTLYWTSRGTGVVGGIWMLRTTDKAPVALASGQAGPRKIGISADKVYWVNAGSTNSTDGSIAWTWR